MLLRASRRYIQRHDAHQSTLASQRYCRLSSTLFKPGSNQLNFRPSRPIPQPQLEPGDSRNLVTVTESVSPPADFIHFDTVPPTSTPLLSKTWDPLIIHHDILATAPPRLSFTKGIGGEPAELLQNLHACLRVGRLDRAAALVRRLQSKLGPDAIEVLDAHSLYIQGLAQSIEQDIPGVTISDMDEWFKQELLQKEVKPDARIFVAIIKSTIACIPDQTTRNTKIRGYLRIITDRGKEFLEQVMSDESFTDSDFIYLVSLQPEQFDIYSDELKEISPEESSMPELKSSKGPSVKSVQQRGHGLTTLKKSLSLFEDDELVIYPHHIDGTKEEKDRIYAQARQVRLEEDCVDSTIERWRLENDNLAKIGVSAGNKSLELVMWQWYNSLLASTREELKEVHKALNSKVMNSADRQRHTDRLIYGSYLENFTAEQLAAITLITIMRSVTASDHLQGLRLSQLTNRLGEALEQEFLKELHVKNLLGPNSKSSSHREKILAKISKRPMRRRILTSTLESAETLRDVPSYLEFPGHIKSRIGALLIQKLLESATVVAEQRDAVSGELKTATLPAFSHTQTYFQGKRIGRIFIHSAVAEQIKKEPFRGAIGSRLPMLCPPVPWTGFKTGGFLRYPVAVVRSKNGDETQVQYAKAAIRKGDMEMVFAGLNVLGKTPWRINQAVFKTMVEVWNTGKAFGEIAPESVDVVFPPEPAPNASSAERVLWLQEIKRLQTMQSSAHSQRCFQNFQLETARAYLNETFYYPHNVDFRGRAYPIPQILNHMGSDMSRGLLQFGIGKELGTVGLSWLRVHLANLYGFDKASLKEREDFTSDHIDDIRDSAENPLTGRRWWTKAEDPWQCLATCIELNAALLLPDPTKFVSYLAVHQDGTCNGLQHYAALGGDEAGASQVNLEPRDRPSDIYSTVAGMVQEQVEEEAREGHKYAQFLRGKISRKVVKRTVMTNVYGVTFSGARLQVLDELETIFPDFKSTAEIYSLAALSTYITRKIFWAVSQLFNGAYAIQCWLGECADRISMSVTPEQVSRFIEERESGQVSTKEKTTATKNPSVYLKSSVIWTTPLRMPVAQPYRASKSKQIKTCLQMITITESRAKDPVLKRKQLQAFPPNFIHSLDATHMLLSALACEEKGLTFAAVHDSFWTHAADVPVMNGIVRDTFIRMHSEDIVGRLAEEFKARYAGSHYAKSVVANTPLGIAIESARRNLIKESTRNRPHQGFDMVDELIIEHKREKLLQSEDPKERRAGEAMVTPASVYAKFMNAENETLVAPTSLKGTLLGDISQRQQSKPIATKANPEPSLDMSQTQKSVETSDLESFDDVVKHEKEMETEAAQEMYEDEGEDEEGGEVDAELLGASKRRKKSDHTSGKKILVWLPISFPSVPLRGSFDVKRLKNSTYFFS